MDNIEIADEILSSASSAFDTLKTTSTAETVTALHNKTMLELVQTDDAVQTKVTETAKEAIATNLDTLKIQNKTEQQKIRYEANREACELCGLTVRSPNVIQFVAKWGMYIWQAIYVMIATVTIVPIRVFTTGLASVLGKHKWLNVLLALLLYILIVVGIPLLVGYRDALLAMFA